MCLGMSCMVVIMVEKPFCAHERSTTFVVHGFEHERCTAILVGSSMLLSVYMPHSGRDEEDYIEALETVRNVMTEGRMAGAVSQEMRYSRGPRRTRN